MEQHNGVTRPQSPGMDKVHEKEEMEIKILVKKEKEESLDNSKIRNPVSFQIPLYLML